MRAIVVSIFILMLAGFAFSANVTGCMDITAPGTYTLTQDITGAPTNVSTLYGGALGPDWACIVLSSDDVVLDCDGHSISTPGKTRAAGMVANASVFSQRNNLTIQNCEIYDYSMGAALRFYSNASILDNDFHNNAYGLGISIGMQDAMMEDNEIHGNTAAGMFVEGVLVLQIVTTPTNLDVYGDHFYDNTIDVYVAANGTSGNAVLLQLFNVIFDNPTGDYTQSINLSMGDLVPVGAQYYLDWYAGGTPEPGYLAFKDAYLEMRNLTPSGPIDVVVFKWRDDEITGPFQESMFELWEYDYSTWSDLGAIRNTAVNFLQRLNVVPNGVYSILQDASCPAPITSPGTYSLSNSVIGAPNDITSFNASSCVRIASSDVVFDCNGYDITNNGTGVGTRMTVGVIADGNYDNITIQNCPSISGYTYGAGLDHADNSVIREVVTHHNGHAGIYIARSGNNNLVENCTSHSHPVAGIFSPQYASDGFYMFSGTGNTFKDNIAYNNTYGFDIRPGASGTNMSGGDAYYNTYGFYVDSNTNVNYLEDNEGHDNYYGFFSESSTGDVYTGNTAEDNLQDGFVLYDSSGIGLYDNTALDNQNGFLLNMSDGNYMEDSFALGNLNGYLLTGGSDDNVLFSNTADSNNDNGFRVYGGANNTLTSGIAQDNTNNGIYLVGSTTTDSVVFNNSLHSNTNGLALNQASLSDISANDMYGNTGSGLAMINSDHNQIYGNTAHDNVGVGMSISSNSDHNTVTGNQAWENGNFGFYLGSNTNNTLEDNLAVDNLNRGFHLSSAWGNRLIGNNATQNSFHGFSTLNSDNNNFTGNIAWNNSDHGFHIQSSDGNTLLDNIAYDCDIGFDIDDSAGNALMGNNASANAVRGIHIDTSPGSTLMGNVVHGNPEGIRFQDSDGTMISGDHLFANGLDLFATGAGEMLTLSGVIFDIDAGNLTNYTNLSLSDAVGEDYSLDWTSEPPTMAANYDSFEGKFVNLTNYSAMSIDSMTWHWLESELAGYSENALSLMAYDGAWHILNQTEDAVANTLSYSDIDMPYVLAILEFQAIDTGDDDKGGGLDSMDVELESTCDGNVVTADDGDPVKDADVLVWEKNSLSDVAIGKTDSDGEFNFTGCGMDVKIIVKKSGYSQVSLVRSLVDCAQCVPMCVVDGDCDADESCDQGACVPVQCPCGEILDHQCSAYQCCADQDCEQGQVCQDNSCIDQAVPECDSDGDCDADESCSEGVCEEVSGQCGYAADHAWVGYDCGDEEGCDECADGSICVEHECVPDLDIEGPDTAFLGDRVSLIATLGDGPCADCEMLITLPDGSTMPGRTDAQGGFEMPLNLQGDYAFSLLRDGQPFKTLTVESLAKPVADEEKPPSGIFDDLGAVLLWLILVIIIIVLAVIYKGRAKRA